MREASSTHDTGSGRAMVLSSCRQTPAAHMHGPKRPVIGREPTPTHTWREHDHAKRYRSHAAHSRDRHALKIAHSLSVAFCATSHATAFSHTVGSASSNSGGMLVSPTSTADDDSMDVRSTPRAALDATRNNRDHDVQSDDSLMRAPDRCHYSTHNELSVRIARDGDVRRSILGEERVIRRCHR